MEPFWELGSNTCVTIHLDSDSDSDTEPDAESLSESDPDVSVGTTYLLRAVMALMGMYFLWLLSMILKAVASKATGEHPVRVKSDMTSIPTWAWDL